MSKPTKEEFARSKYLIYSQFETRSRMGGSIGGSLLIDCAMTQQDAEAKLAIYRQRLADFRIQSPLSSNQKTSHVFIENDPEWWSY